MHQELCYGNLKERKKGVGRPTRRWERVIKIDLKGIGWECVESTHLAQDRDSVLLQNSTNQFIFTKCRVFLD
jgi:hypothetical protein